MLHVAGILTTLVLLARVHVQAVNLAFLTVFHEDTLYKAIIPADGGIFAFTKVLDTGREPRQISYDPVEKKIYWIEDNTRMIRRCDLDGGNVDGYGIANNPWGIALDYTNRVIYYSDYTSDGVSSLSIADFTTPSSSTIVVGTVAVGANPRQIGFGTETSSLYVAQSGASSVVRYNGGTSTELFSPAERDTIDRPTGIFVDEVAQRLFYSDDEENNIRVYNLMDMTKTTIYSGPSSSEPRGMSAYKDDLYYCDFNRDGIYKINKNGMDDLTMSTLVVVTIDGVAPTGTVLNGVSDIHFFIEQVGCVSNLVATTNSANQISLTWDAATSLCPADVYRVTYEVINADQCSAVISPTSGSLEWQAENSATLENLKAYTTYKIIVTGGVRDLADTSIITPGMNMEVQQDTNEDAPAASPTQVLLESMVQNTAVFSWSEIPCGSRAGDILSYTYQLTSNNQVIFTGMTSKQFVVIDHGVLFDVLPCGAVTFGVAGNTAIGTGSDFGNVDYQLTSTESFQPGTSVTISNIGQTTAVVSWSPTECQPSDYTISYTIVNLNQCQATSTAMSFGTVSSSPVTLTGLAPGSSYEVAVSGSITDGSSRTLTTAFMTLPSIPTGPPSNLRSHTSSGPATTTLEWDDIPCESRQGIITSYEYKVYANGNLIDSAQTPNTAVDLTNLPCGPITFQVAGGTTAGFGEHYAELELEIISTDPFEAGTALEITSVTTSSARISWSASQCPPSPRTVTYALTNLEQCMETSSNISRYGDTVEDLVTLTGLLPGSTYRVTVSGQTKAGNMAIVEAFLTTQVGAPLEGPTNVRLVSSDASTLTFAWDEVPCGRRGGVLHYDTALLPSTGGITISTQQMSSTTATISGLASDANYRFQVNAVTSAGLQESGLINSQTKGAVSKAHSLQLTILQIDNQPPVCLPQYAEPVSLEFIQVSSRFTERMNIILIALDGFQFVRVNGIRCGSLIVDFQVVVDSSSETTVTDISNTIYTAAGADGNIGDLIYIKSDGSELCPAGYCPDGIECIADVSNVLSLCRCASGELQTRCDDETQTNNQTSNEKGTIIIISSSVGLLIAILFGVVFILFVCRRRKRRPAANVNNETRPVLAAPNFSHNGVASPWSIRQRQEPSLSQYRVASPWGIYQRQQPSLSHRVASPWGIHQRQILNPSFDGLTYPGGYW